MNYKKRLADIIQELACEFYLTNKEKEIYYYMCQGMTPVTICKQLNTEVSTVRKQINNLYNKLNINNINELLSLVIMRGLS